MTDDEREALMKLTDVACGPRADERYADGWSGARQEIRLRIAAWPGFRRSEVPEPSAEHVFGIAGEHKVCRTCGLADFQHEPQGEPSDAQVRAAQEVLAKWRPMPESVVRDALRAAGGVR